MTSTTTYTDLINLYALRLTGLRDELVNVAQFPLTAARNSLIAINNAVELACHDAGKNWGPILSEGVNIKAASRAKFIQRITEALEGLDGLKAALIKYSGESARQAEVEQVPTCFARGTDVLEVSGVRVALPVCISPDSADTDQLEVDVEPAVLVAGLACGFEPEAIEDAYMGEWDSDEDMAAEQWEQGGMLDGVPDAVRSYIGLGTGSAGHAAGERCGRG